ncbi:hypothetical protein Tco_0367370 [Tanacetum coccineum]
MSDVVQMFLAKTNTPLVVVVGECGEESEVYWWRRVEKVVVGRIRYGGVMVVEEIKRKMKKIWNKRLKG